MINVFQPTLGGVELQKIKEVFDSNWIGKGKLVTEFEEKWANHVGSTANRVLTTNCCSEGLFSSMHLCDIQPGDEVILPTISFVGAGNAICANGSKMVLCDVDRRNLNATAADIEKCITKKTKAILLLHFGGIPCEMDEIMKLADAYNLKVIEDCAAGVCSSYKGRALGTFGDIGMWSFDAMKILVCGDGSALHFRDPELRERAEKWLYFGLEAKSGYENSVAQKWWEFDISCFGHRAIMNDYKETGITIMFMAPGMDDGDIIKQDSIDIKDEDNVGSIHSSYVVKYFSSSLIKIKFFFFSFNIICKSYFTFILFSSSISSIKYTR